MTLIRFLTKYSPKVVVLAIVAGLVSGASNAALLALFNAALKNGGRDSAGLVWAFAALCLFLPLTRFFSEVQLTYVAQHALLDMRMRLCRKIIAAPLRHLEKIGPHKVLAVLAEDVPAITSSLTSLPLLCINTAITIGGLLYLGWLSWIVLLTVLCFLAIGILTYQLPVVSALRAFKRAREHADSLFKHFRSIIFGAKELKLHHERREAFLNGVLLPTAESLKKHMVAGNTIYTAATSWGQVLVFIVIGLILFALPAFKPVTEETLIGYTLTLLYLMTPLQGIMNSAPNLARAGVALQNAENLGFNLQSTGVEGDYRLPLNTSKAWSRLDMIGISHSYDSEGEKHSFQLGPIDLSLGPGELVFISGGNGSGKTTLAKLLSGLYIPEAGEIRLDGQPITDHHRESYRQYFSTVFSDFYLFDSLLGIECPNLDHRAGEYLKRLMLEGKVEIKDRTLSTIELSQGQRKRLALLTAFLEDRPLYIFDEWAADQDPQFKEVFYHSILPELKARGRTAIIISHDEKYYEVGDRIIKLDYGRISSERLLSRPQARCMSEEIHGDACHTSVDKTLSL